MRERINGVDLPAAWRSLSLDALIALADTHGVVYWIDEEAIARQIRQAILAASEVDYYAPATLTPTNVVSPEDEARHSRAATMRDAGMSWNDVAEALGYSSSGAVVSAVKAHCRRVGRDFPRPTAALRRGDTERAREALALRRGDEYRSWRSIAEQLGYKSANQAYDSVAVYCKSAGEDFPRYDKRQRALQRTGRAYCTNGHPMTSDNVYLRVNGQYRCRVCRREEKKRARQRAQGLVG